MRAILRVSYSKNSPFVALLFGFFSDRVTCCHLALSSLHFTTFLIDAYCLFQIADAVVVARYLGATLVVPDIRGKELGDKW